MLAREKMEAKNRKPNRLSGFDYSQTGAYFITICTKDRQCILSQITDGEKKYDENVGEGLRALPQVKLSDIGKKVEQSILFIETTYGCYRVARYVIMPNHIHLLITKSHPAGGHGDPPLQDMIGRLKSYTTKQYGSILWQRSFYDHIIRNEQDYTEHLQYIDQNPTKWLLGKDEYYC